MRPFYKHEGGIDEGFEDDAEESSLDQHGKIEYICLKSGNTMLILLAFIFVLLEEASILISMSPGFT